jgi:hypothetical protein
MSRRVLNWSCSIAVLILWLGLLSIPTHADSLSDLDKAFRDAYSLATRQTLAELRTQVPVLVNRFGQIALYRPGVDQPEIFSMDMALYLEARSIAHTPVALVARLAPFGLGPLDSMRLDWLTAFETLLVNAADELTGRTDIPNGLKTAQRDMLATVRRFAQRIRQHGEIDQATLDEIGLNVRAGIRANLEAAAASQLEQFRAQILKWKSTYPTLAWNRAVVVMIGIHQARSNYLQWQFFDWMLYDQPGKQERVVFAETLAPPPPIEKDATTDAITLLSKVMLDKTLATSIFGDALALQSDVLGGVAEDIIRRWPPP